MTRSEVLDTAKSCVCGDREQDYGTPEDNFSTIAALWEPYLKRKCVSLGADVCVEAEDVAVLMTLVKIGRIASGNAKADNWVDGCGYLACGGEIEAAQDKPVTGIPATDEPKPSKWEGMDNDSLRYKVCTGQPCGACPLDFAHNTPARLCNTWVRVNPTEARRIMIEYLEKQEAQDGTHQ